jgi:flagellar biosynthesis/type III secretory pathway M-ring protein FliF/YscJ
MIPAVETLPEFFVPAVERGEGMEAQYAYWIVTFAVGLMVAALAWFIRRLIAELENKIERSEKATGERMDALEKRMNRQEDRYDVLLTQLPEKYALRDDLIRMTQNIEAQLSQIRELIVNGFCEREGI